MSSWELWHRLNQLLQDASTAKHWALQPFLPTKHTGYGLARSGPLLTCQSCYFFDGVNLLLSGIAKKKKKKKKSFGSSLALFQGLTLNLQTQLWPLVERSILWRVLPAEALGWLA